MLPVAVLAGGIGSRVAHLTHHQPKAMLEVAGRPFIDFKLAGLAAAGVTDVVALVGHGGDALRAHVGAGERFGLRVSWVDDGTTLRGTGGALLHALDHLPDAFWVTYGDTLLDVPLERAEQELADRDASCLMTVLENRDQWHPSNVDVAEGRVVEYRKGAPRGTFRYIDYGMLILARRVLTSIPVDACVDLVDVLQPLVEAGALLAFEVHERFHEIGTEEGWRETDAWARGTRAWDRMIG